MQIEYDVDESQPHNKEDPLFERSLETVKKVASFFSSLERDSFLNEFSNVSSKYLLEQLHSYIDCI